MKKTLISSIIFITCFSFVWQNASAETTIFYRGIHFGKAWIEANGRLLKLKPGESTKGNVQLLAANEDEIIIKVDGKRYKYLKGNQVGTLFEEKITLLRDPGSGNYWVNGAINNQTVQFIVDTGASYVTLNKDMARNMKIKRGQNKVEVYTATKKETAYLVSLNSVRIGGIEVKNIPALITQHKFPPTPLLGMSFLEKVEISQLGNQMTLKYSGK